jgi:hypothetical protein
LAGHSTETVVLDAVNRRGHAFRCRVRISQLRGSGEEIEGVILLLDEATDSTEEDAG